MTLWLIRSRLRTIRPKAAELTLQADAIVSNDYAVLPLYYKSNNYLMHDNISGFYMTASGNLFFKDVKVG